MRRVLNEQELVINLNEYLENTKRIDFQFHGPKLSWESCFSLSFNYTGLHKECSTKEATDIIQRRAP